MDLDTLLDQAAPQLAERTPGLTAVLDEMVLAARPPVRRRRRTALTAGAVCLAGVVAVGGAAAAGVGPGIPRAFYDWTSDQGSTCTVGLTFEPSKPGDIYYSTSIAPALAEARAWVAAFDIDSVDVAAAEDRWLTHIERIDASRSSRSELEQTFRGNDLETYAIGHEIDRRLAEHMKSKGLAMTGLNSAVAVGCEQ